MLLTPQVVALPARTTVLEACEFFIQHRFLAFPVVDEGRRLLGVVDVELYTDEVTKLEDGRVRDDLFQLLGVHVDATRDDSPLGAFLRRFPWLGCNLAAGILAAFLSSLYREELDRVVALAFFIPVVLNLAESVSSQSVSLALQMLHGQPALWKMLPYRLAGELATGLMLGLTAGGAVGMVGLAWLGQARVALCLLGGIGGGVASAAILGMAVPFVLRLLRLEPRVAAGPIALAGADVITILLYLNLCAGSSAGSDVDPIVPTPRHYFKLVTARTPLRYLKRIRLDQARRLACRRRPRCTRATTEGREMTLRPRELHEALPAARRQQEAAEWKAEHAVRAGVEGTLSQESAGSACAGTSACPAGRCYPPRPAQAFDSGRLSLFPGHSKIPLSHVLNDFAEAASLGSV